jgi:hypothetical protein
VIWFYLSSGLFLGWSLGANDAANIFGTAVGTKMVRFKTAASIARRNYPFLLLRLLLEELSAGIYLPAQKQITIHSQLSCQVGFLV